MSAPAPSRSSGSFSISFGLLNVPISIYAGTEEVRVKRSQYTRDGEKVGNQTCVKNDDDTYGRAVSRDEVIKKYDTGHGLVDLDDAELDALATTTPGVADLLGVMPFGLLANGSYVPNGQVWQVRASKLGSGRAAKPNPGGEKAFALLLAALRAEQSFALIRFGKGGTVYHGALLPTGRLVGLYADDEVRADRDLPATDNLSPEEVALARQLVAAAKTPRVEIHNEMVTKVAQYAEAKLAAKGAPVMAPEVAPKQTTDLMALLRQSVEAAKVSA